MSRCMVKDCRHAGTHYLTVKAWAMGVPKSTEPLTITLGLQFCRDHAAEEVKSKQLISDEFWQRLELINQRLGKGQPDRASVELFALRGNAKDAIERKKVDA